MNSHMCRASKDEAAAEALIKAFSGAAAAAVLKSKGMEPAS